MKKILSIAFGAAIALSAMAVPAKRTTQTITTSDGQHLQATFSGDESFHYWMGSDGVRYSEQDGIFYAISEAETNAAIKRSSARRSAMRNTSARRVVAQADGTTAVNLAPRGLLILANFKDKTFQSTNTQAQMDSMLNGTNYTYNNQAIGSARKYFQDQSKGTYNPKFDVVGPVTLPQNMAYYGANNSSGDDVMCGEMVLHACSIAAALPGVDMSNYDNDRDGYIDFVYIIYAGYNEAEGYGANTNTIWPASWNITSAIYYGRTSINSNDYNKTSNYTYDGKILDTFAYSSELKGKSGTTRAGIGTFCHEFSHVIGLPDYYDTEYGSNYDNSRTPGEWSLMDGGSYNVSGQVPPAYSIYDKFFVGWATPTVLNTPSDVTITADGFTGCYINSTGTSGKATSTATTYYIENRQQSSWDKGLPGHGMLVWQVKYNSSKWNANTPNNTAGSPLITVLSASGNTTGIGTEEDPFPGTGKVNSWAPFTNYPLTDIEETAGVITFKFMGGKQCRGYEVYFTATNATHSSTVECIPQDSAWKDTITAATDYHIKSVSVRMGTTQLTDVVTLSADGTQAFIAIPAVSGDIVIEATTARNKGESGFIDCDDYSWAATMQVADGTRKLGAYTWDITATGGSHRGYDSSKGAEYGSSSSPTTLLKLTTSDPEDCLINALKVNMAKTQTSTAELTLYIGGEKVGKKSIAVSSSTYTFYNTMNLQGEVEIQISNSAGVFYLKSINITYRSNNTALPEEQAAEEGEIIGIYTTTGIAVGTSLENLPRGMYIIRRTSGTQKIIK